MQWDCWKLWLSVSTVIGLWGPSILADYEKKSRGNRPVKFFHHQPEGVIGDSYASKDSQDEGTIKGK